MTSAEKHSRTPILILAGGLGTRLSEETYLKPKPMLEVGGIPLLIHIMRTYYAHGFNDFVICGGYRSIEIKKFFLTYPYFCASLEIDLRNPAKEVMRPLVTEQERWRVRVLDTGADTMTGGRVARALDFLSASGDWEHFGLTYGDGLSDIDLSREFQFHCDHGKLGTVTGVTNASRYGELELAGEKVKGFHEKDQNRQGLISGGYFFFKRQFRDRLDSDPGLVLEKAPLAKLAGDDELRVYRHTGFWASCDTLRDLNHLRTLWDKGNAPWKPAGPMTLRKAG